MLVFKMYQLVLAKYWLKPHYDRKLNKLIFNQYNRYKLILNQYLTNITDTL